VVVELVRLVKILRPTTVVMVVTVFQLLLTEVPLFTLVVAAVALHLLWGLAVTVVAVMAVKIAAPQVLNLELLILAAVVVVALTQAFLQDRHQAQVVLES
jgi:hypothetical protein